jgi:uncharacterized protein (TIGR00162 family)
MKETEVRFLSKPKLKSPIVIEGLPGIGLVGKIAADHLITQTKAKKFCELYSPFFPPQVITDDDGIVRLVKNDFYYFTDKGRSFIVIGGDFQGMSPESQYEISGKILDVLAHFKPKIVYTLGGLGTGKVPKETRVYAATNNKKLIESHKKFGLTFKGRGGGGIFGASGLLLGLGKLRDMDAVCLMGETVGHVVDAKAASILLEKLAKILNLKVDMKDLDKEAKKTEKELQKIQKLQEEQAKALQMATVNSTSDEDVIRYIR